MPPLPTSRLLRVTRAQKALLASWQEGCSLEAAAGQSISQLHTSAVSDRLRLAACHRRDALAALHASPARYRSAASRAYYAIYHALRAAAYLHHIGDDYEGHSDLPGKLPADFPNLNHWQNALKDARERRNRADYDPYPDSARAWAKDAAVLVPLSGSALREVRAYMRQKGH